MRFAEQTGIDALAVAVGSSHAMTNRTAELDLELITKIKKAVPVPLVLHGSSGVPESTLTDAVRAGMAKINIATHLNRIFTGALSGFIAANAGVVDTRKYLGVARTAVEAEAARLLQLLALR
jgi:fructose-bisphosphate aldolase class II